MYKSIKNAMFCWVKRNKNDEGSSFVVVEHPDYGHLSDSYIKTNGACCWDWNQKEVCNYRRVVWALCIGLNAIKDGCDPKEVYDALFDIAEVRAAAAYEFMPFDMEYIKNFEKKYDLK